MKGREALAWRWMTHKMAAYVLFHISRSLPLQKNRSELEDASIIFFTILIQKYFKFLMKILQIWKWEDFFSELESEFVKMQHVSFLTCRQLFLLIYACRNWLMVCFFIYFNFKTIHSFTSSADNDASNEYVKTENFNEASGTNFCASCLDRFRNLTILFPILFFRKLHFKLITWQLVGVKNWQ